MHRQIMKAAMKIKPSHISGTNFSTKVHPKIIANCKKFQTNIDEPVYLKGGTPDKILFGMTCAGVTLGVLLSVKTLVQCAFPSA